MKKIISDIRNCILYIQNSLTLILDIQNSNFGYLKKRLNDIRQRRSRHASAAAWDVVRSEGSWTGLV